MKTSKFPIWAFIPPIMFLGLAALFLAGLNRDNPNALPSAMIGRTAPQITSTPLGNLPVLTADQLLEPNIKLVNFWSSWCGPCRAEHPTLTQLAAEGIPIYGINYKDTDANALAFLAELGDPYTAISTDKTGRTAINWGAYGVPETFIIDAQGEILLRHPGPITQRVLQEIIRPLLSE